MCKVQCPNICISGKVKHYPNPEKALFDLVTCPYCKGEGEVTKEKAIEIEKKL